MPEGVVEVLGDVTLLEQAVSNVVHNAVSYADANVAVVLETAGTPPTGFRLRVLDDGPGIPADELARVTERAYRGVTGRTRRPGGGGLGLAIVKDVLDRHGFTLALAVRGAARPRGHARGPPRGRRDGGRERRARLIGRTPSLGPSDVGAV